MLYLNIMVVLSCPAIATVKIILLEIQNVVTAVEEVESKLIHANNAEC